MFIWHTALHLIHLFTHIHTSVGDCCPVRRCLSPLGRWPHLGLVVSPKGTLTCGQLEPAFEPPTLPLEPQLIASTDQFQSKKECRDRTQVVQQRQQVCQAWQDWLELQSCRPVESKSWEETDVCSPPARQGSIPWCVLNLCGLFFELRDIFSWQGVKMT